LQAQLNKKDTEITSLKALLAERDIRISELEKLVPPYRKGEWNLIATFQGQSEVTTNYFYVAGTELRINWTWTSRKGYASFSVDLYDERNNRIEHLGLLQNEGSSYVHNIEAGNYYLKISTLGIDRWTVTVEVFISD